MPDPLHLRSSGTAGCRGDLAVTKSAFIRYFRRGLKASLLLQELMDNLPAIMARTDYSASDAAGVITMLKALNLHELTIQPPQESSSAGVV